MLFASSLFRLAWINIFLGPYRQSTRMVEFKKDLHPQGENLLQITDINFL